MGKQKYSLELCRRLFKTARGAELEIAYRPKRYDEGDVLDLDFTTAWPESEGRGRFRIEKFVGGGFAGQVYRCVLEEVVLPANTSNAGLTTGGVYAIKIMLPPTGFSRWFRNAIYWLAFQSPFSASVNKGACRSGLLWVKIVRSAMSLEYGCENAVADAYASFYDQMLRSYGEIREWVDGRTWRLEPDTAPRLRRKWRRSAPTDTLSPEYVAKRQFMHRFVKLLHKMGGGELARQYEWWTMKSQPNVLKRSGYEGDPAAGLCAVDFRAGLALLPFLPMSPRDVTLILRGILHGSLVQFDRVNYQALRQFAAAHPELTEMSEALIRYDKEYRRSMPDITHQGVKLLLKSSLRREVRKGLVEGYSAADMVDERFADRLKASPLIFTLFYLLGAIPLFGKFLRRVWGSAGFRRHIRLFLTKRAYFHRTIFIGAVQRLIEWHRTGRCGERRIESLLRRPLLFWLQRLTIGFLPAKVHRVVAEPSYVRRRIRESVQFLKSFYRDEEFRERWFTELIRQGYDDGMLDRVERDTIMSRIRDPFIVKYLKCLAVHFATLPITQIVSVAVATVVAVSALLSGASWGNAGVRFALILGLFQVTPISPGSICRGAYVVYLVIKERDFRSYLIAAPVSFVKYIGYLAFPFQMVTTYPALSRFMASRWATSAVHIIPVFGEKGALLEHIIFDAFFNIPRIAAKWARGRVTLLLDMWLLFGLLILTYAFWWRGMQWSSPAGINIIIGAIVLCILPRVLFYPMLTAKNKK